MKPNNLIWNHIHRFSESCERERGVIQKTSQSLILKPSIQNSNWGKSFSLETQHPSFQSKLTSYSRNHINVLFLRGKSQLRIGINFHHKTCIHMCFCHSSPPIHWILLHEIVLKVWGWLFINFKLFLAKFNHIYFRWGGKLENLSPKFICTVENVVSFVHGLLGFCPKCELCSNFEDDFLLLDESWQEDVFCVLRKSHENLIEKWWKLLVKSCRIERCCGRGFSGVEKTSCIYSKVSHKSTH